MISLSINFFKRHGILLPLIIRICTLFQGEEFLFNEIIDRKSLTEYFSQLSDVGVLPEGGVTRLAFTPEEEELHKIVGSWLLELGAQVRRDSFGNLIGRFEGFDGSLPAIAIGSHLDSVPAGGNFDGIVGVVAGVAVARAIQMHHIPVRHPLEVIAFVGEESSRFGVATLGSKVMTGRANLSYLLNLRDADGITLKEALTRRGGKIEDLASASRRPSEFRAFLEVHIEQGRVLEEAGTKIGIVTAIAAPTRWLIEIEGRADHSGATPMHMRRDALAAAAELILEVERQGNVESGYQTVATIGKLSVKPGVMNVIPGHVGLGLDVRGIDKESIKRAIATIRSGLEELCRRRVLSFKIHELSEDQPLVLDEQMKGSLESICKEMDVPYILMSSGAGHDAMNMARLTSTGLIFIPCRNGISHNPSEKAEIEDIALGAEVLLNAVMKLDI